jgi:hypothetical protein
VGPPPVAMGQREGGGLGRLAKRCGRRAQWTRAAGYSYEYSYVSCSYEYEYGGVRARSPYTGRTAQFVTMVITM